MDSARQDVCLLTTHLRLSCASAMQDDGHQCRSARLRQAEFAPCGRREQPVDFRRALGVRQEAVFEIIKTLDGEKSRGKGKIGPCTLALLPESESRMRSPKREDVIWSMSQAYCPPSDAAFGPDRRRRPQETLWKEHNECDWFVVLCLSHLRASERRHMEEGDHRRDVDFVASVLLQLTFLSHEP